MQNWKIVIVTTTIAILAVATISLSFAHNLGGSSYYGGMMGYSDYDGETEDWWTEMREHMNDHWDEVQDEEWFDEMTQYMEDRNGNGYGRHGCH